MDASHSIWMKSTTSPGPVLPGRRLGAARLPAACAAAAAGLPAVGGHDAARRHRAAVLEREGTHGSGWIMTGWE